MFFVIITIFWQYMKAIHAAVTTSQPIATENEINTIFYKIPELYSLHSNFLETLKNHTEKSDNSKIGDCFKTMVNITNNREK